MAIAAERMGEIGIELLSVDVRDVMVPAELKRAYAAVVAARQEGAVSLERARGETAALRSLANAGRLLDDHPGLLSLRLVQELGDPGWQYGRARAARRVRCAGVAVRSASKRSPDAAGRAGPTGLSRSISASGLREPQDLAGKAGAAGIVAHDRVGHQGLDPELLDAPGAAPRRCRP